MRITRSQHLDTLRQTTTDQPRPAASPARHRPVQDGFEPARKRGPSLTSPQNAAVDVLANELLKAIAQQLLAAANGMAAKTGDQGQPTPVGSASDEFTPPPPPVGGGDEWTPPPPPPVETTPVSGFSPGPPPGVVDPRIPPPITATEKRADTYPASLPGESLAQYAMRTSKDTGFNVNLLGAFVSTAGNLGGAPNASFAELVDRFQNPNAYLSQAEIDRANNLRAADLETANRIYTGPVPASSLTDEDRKYLISMEQWEPGVGDLFHRLLSGSHVEIARLINDTVYNLGGVGKAELSTYRGQLRPLVEKVMAEKGLVHP
ncbi:MAG: hypothetical protein Q8L14_12155 [Myxococcales bacterium]|nr:hypothetical protein [Myxococcales bacterium]